MSSAVVTDALQVKTTMYKVSDFVSWQRSKSLELSPKFQRRPVWSKSAKSFLIDTVTRGLPVPPIIIREEFDSSGIEPIREVVDGQQRLRTIFSFIDPVLLKNFDEDKDQFTVRKSHNDELAGKHFLSLASVQKQQILNYEFAIHILPLGTDDRLVLEIFARLNSTGLKANRQELRNAKYFGELKTLMYDLAYEQLTRWRNWRVFTENNIARMDEVETTSELSVMMMSGIQKKDQNDIDNWYNKNDKDFEERTELESRFRVVMDSIDDTIGNELRTLIFSRKALFYVLFSIYYDVLFGIGSSLSENLKPKLLPRNIKEALRGASLSLQNDDLPQQLNKALRGATTDADSRRQLKNYVQENFLNR